MDKTGTSAERMGLTKLSNRPERLTEARRMNILQILKLVSEDVDSEWQAVLEFLFPMGHAS
jgi:hypothetical protein